MTIGGIMRLGEELVKLRETRGLSISQLSEITHIGQHVLQELESGDYSRISAAIYGKGFIKIIARYYGIAEAPLCECFAAEYQEWIEQKNALPKPRTAPQKFTTSRNPNGNIQPTPTPKPAPSPAPKPAPQSKPSPAPKPTPKPASASAAAPAPISAPQQIPPVQTSATVSTQDTAQIPIHDYLEPIQEQEEPESFGELFSDIENSNSEVSSATVVPPPLPTPPVRTVPVYREQQSYTPASESSKDSKPESVSSQSTTFKPDSAPLRQKRKSNFGKKLRGNCESALAFVKTIVQSTAFKHIGIAVLAIGLATWICTLFLGDGEVKTQENTAEEYIANIEPQSDDLEMAGDETSAVVESDEVPEASEQESVAITFVGTALTDNLLPPPDCYAE